MEVNDLNTTLNQGATYFAEAQYVAASEYTWCQAHPAECNMYNNASYRQFLVSGTTNFSFSPLGDTARMQPAIWAWTGATVNRLEPDPGNDGFWFIGYKVTNPSAGLWHYEYVLYNMNLDRAIQSFTVPLGAGVNISNIGFHAPPQHPGWPNDGTLNSQGYSSTAWMLTQTANSLYVEHGNFCDTIKMPTRFAGAHCITSGSMPTNRHKLQTRQSTSSKQARLCRLLFRRPAKVARRRQRLRLRQLQHHGLLPHPEVALCPGLARHRCLARARNRFARGIGIPADQF